MFENKNADHVLWLKPRRSRRQCDLPWARRRPAHQSVIPSKARSFNISHEEMIARLFGGVSIKRFVDPSDIAHQIVFLASPFGKTISGQQIPVCGDTRMLV